MENAIGYILFLLSGILFGLFGAGGSLITIPILMIFFSLSFKISTTYSLIIVFLVSFFGVISSSNSMIYRFKSILFFGTTSLFGVFFSRNFLFHIVPEEILIRMFVGFLFISGLVMLYKKREQFNQLSTEKIKYFPLLLQGFLVGNLTGLLGVGGGFLIVPILIIFQKFNIKQAAKASIFLIFLNSWFAIIVDLSNNFFNFDSKLFFFILLFSIIGLLIGKKTQNAINIKMMHKLFAFFLIVISLLLGFNIQLFL